MPAAASGILCKKAASKVWSCRLANPTTTRDIKGDFGPKDFTDANGNIVYHYDDLNNLVTDPAKGGARADNLNGSSGNDHIMSGAGDDYISATQGGSDFIEAGSGRGQVTAGAGNDVVIGGSEGDILSGGAGDDVIYGNEGNGRMRWRTQLVFLDRLAENDGKVKAWRIAA